MGDILRKVQSGDKLRIPAGAYNLFVDTAKDYQARRQNGGANTSPQIPMGNLVRVKNTSGSDCERFDVLGIDGVVFNPADGQSFQNNIVLIGKVPSSASHSDGKFIICAEPIRDSAIGFAWASGTCQVEINITDAGHNFADITDGDHSQLVSSSSGPVVILWKESGTGAKWAIVRFGATGGGGSSLMYVEIIEGLSYPSPQAPEDSDTYRGRSWYNCRLTGSSPASPWQAGQDYVGVLPNVSIVSLQNVNFRCRMNHKSSSENMPDLTKAATVYWEKVEDIRIDRVLGFEQPTPKDMRNCVPWYGEGEVVPVTMRGSNYYFLGGIYYTGEPDYASLRFLENEKYVAAVFS